MFHRVTILGNVGQEPQMRYTPDGTPVTNLSVAANKKIKKALPGGGERPCPAGWKESYNGKHWEVTTWFRVACWRGLAETVNEYVKKGDQIFIEGELAGDAADGSLSPRVYQRSDGSRAASFEITAQTVKFLGNGGGAPVQEAPPETGEEDALPF